MRTSEARKRAEDAARAVERRRDLAFDALTRVYHDAERLEADALLDAIDDLGGRLECEP